MRASVQKYVRNASALVVGALHMLNSMVANLFYRKLFFFFFFFNDEEPSKKGHFMYPPLSDKPQTHVKCPQGVGSSDKALVFVAFHHV